MVLVSIIVGLGLAHLLLGLGGIVDRIAGRRQPLRLSIPYLAWHAEVFVGLVLFWWWPLRRICRPMDGWALLLPRPPCRRSLPDECCHGAAYVEVVDDLGRYFLDRRIWFYALQLFANALDILDSYLKGGLESLARQPAGTLLLWVVVATSCVVGFRATSLRLHAAMAVSILAFQIITAFSVLPRLGF